MTKPTILFPHTAIYTPNLAESIAFYTTLFGVNPVKVKPGYAKFELHNPKWNFTLNEKQPTFEVHNSVLSHLGFQVSSTEEVSSMLELFKERGIQPTLVETGTTCCYAVQDKFWVRSPEGIDWEVFTVLSDAESFRDDAPGTKEMCCSPMENAQPLQLSIPILNQE
ncbi:MAG: ArsI/CadI family heavy metal resistance metalloenzyme [Chloroherpetonaceae bacterium]|nr:ArsI/CadI family heavy metal resistance metalloenzyme [Chloroherpetonaceae bacterium]